MTGNKMKIFIGRYLTGVDADCIMEDRPDPDHVLEWGLFVAKSEAEVKEKMMDDFVKELVGLGWRISEVKSTKNGFGATGTVEGGEEISYGTMWYRIVEIEI